MLLSILELDSELLFNSSSLSGDILWGLVLLLFRLVRVAFLLCHLALSLLEGGLNLNLANLILLLNKNSGQVFLLIFLDSHEVKHQLALSVVDTELVMLLKHTDAPLDGGLGVQYSLLDEPLHNLCHLGSYLEKVFI